MPMYQEKAALEVLVNGKYGGMGGMSSFENDMSRMGRAMHDTFVKPWQSPQGVIDERWSKAALSMERANNAVKDSELARQKVAAGSLDIDAKRAQMLEREKSAILDVEKAQNRLLTATERYNSARSNALAAPRGSHASQWSVQSSMRSKQIAEQDLLNARSTERAWKMQRQAIDANAPLMMAQMEQTARKRAQYADQMGKAAEKEIRDAKNYEHQMRLHAVQGRINSLAMPGMIAGGAVVGGLAYSTAKAINWQQNIGQVGANTNMSAAEQRWLMTHGLTLMQQMPANQQQILEGYRYAKQSGYSYGNALSLDRQVLKSALPTGADPGMLMFTLTALLKQFGYQGNEAVKHARPMMDYIHTAAATGNMTVDQFANVYGQVGGMASMAKSPEIMLQSMAMLSALTQMHIPYAQASTQVRGFLQQILAPRPTTEAMLQQMYYSSGGKINLMKDFSAQGLRERGIGGVLKDLHDAHLTPQEMRVIFPNMRGMLAGNLLTTKEGLRVFGRTNEKIHAGPTFEGKGATNYEYDQWIKKAGPQLKLLKSNVEAMEIALGTGLLPMVVQFSSAMVPVVKNMTKWIEAHKALIPYIAKAGAALLAVSLAARAFSAILGPLDSSFRLITGHGGLFVTMAKGLYSGLALMGEGVIKVIPMLYQMGAAMFVALGPIGLIVGGLTLLSIGAVVLYKNWTPFRNIVNSTGLALKNFGSGALKDMGKFFQWLGSTIQDSGTKAIKWFKDNWPKLLVTAILFAFLGPVALLFLALPNKWLQYAVNAGKGWIKGLASTASDAEHAAQTWLQGITNWLGFHSPNAHGTDFQKFGASAGKAWRTGLTSQQKSADADAASWVKSIATEMTKTGSLNVLISAGQTIGQTIANAIQGVLSGSIFHIGGVSSGSASGPTRGMPRFITVGGVTTVAGWTTGNAGAPGRTFNPGLGYSTNTPFGNYAGATSNRVDPSDKDMLNAWGVKSSGTIMDTDYASGPPGSRAKHNVVLPGGSKVKWKLLKIGVDKNTGGYEVWQAPNGGIVTFLHLSKEQILGQHQVNTGHGTAPVNGWYAPTPGQTVSGGTVVGVSGHPLTNKYGNDPGFYHLCVVTDAKGRQYVAYLRSGDMQSIKKTGGTVKEIKPSQLAGITGDPSSSGVNLKSSYISGWEKKHFGQLQNIASQTGISMPQLLTLLSMESTGGTDPRAGNNIMQVEPGTFALMGVKNTGTRQSSLTAGAKYFQYLLNGPAHGNVQLAFQMYNGSGYAAVKYGKTAMGRYNALSFNAGNSGVLPNTGSGQLGHSNVHGAQTGIDPTTGLPYKPGTHGMTNAKYWTLMSQMYGQQFHATFPQSGEWKQLSGHGLQLYEWEQWRVWYAQHKEQLANNQVWWNKLTPAQRANKGYQDAYAVMNHQADQAFNTRMRTMRTNVALQPLFQQEFRQKSNYQNLKYEWGLVQHPWTLSKSDQQKWLAGEKSMDHYWAQYEITAAKIYAKQHADQKGIAKWLADRIHAIADAEQQKNANALYRLQHHGASNGAAGRVVPVHIVGHCAEEGKANVHRGNTAKHTKDISGHIKQGLNKQDLTNKKLDAMLKAIDGLKNVIHQGGSTNLPHPGVKPSTREPRYKGRPRKPSSV